MGAAQTPFEGGSALSTSLSWYLHLHPGTYRGITQCHREAKRPAPPAPALPAPLACYPVSGGQESPLAASAAATEKSRQKSSWEIIALS